MIVIDKDFLEKTGIVLGTHLWSNNKECKEYKINEKIVSFRIKDMFFDLDLNTLKEGNTYLPQGYIIINQDGKKFCVLDPDCQPFFCLIIENPILKEKCLKKHTWSKTSTLEYD